MITNWDIISRLDPATKGLLYTLVIDGTEHDARLIAKKLQGYTQNPQPAQAPYVYAFELPADLDEDTLEKIRTATREGIAQTNKVNQFVPGGVLGEPLFTAEVNQEDKDFPTFLTLDPSESFFQPGGTREVEQSGAVNPLEAAPQPGEKPAGTAAPQTDPEETNKTLPIDERDMLIKDMEGTLLDKIPVVEDIFSAQTKYDMFLDAQKSAPAAQAQQQRDQKIESLADGKDSLEETFNIFEQKIKDQTSVIDLEELTAITDRLSVKDLSFIRHANTSPQLAAELAATTALGEENLLGPAPLPAEEEPKNSAAAAGSLNKDTLPEIPQLRAGVHQPEQPLQEGIHMDDNNTNAPLPEEVELLNTISPVKKKAPQPGQESGDLPEITIREQSVDSLEKTFNLETTIKTEQIRTQYEKSFHDTKDPEPMHHKPAQDPASLTQPSIRLKKRTITADSQARLTPKQPQKPAPAEPPTFRLRRKTAAAPQTPPAPAAKTPVPPAPQSAPSQKTVAPGGLEKTKTIDHSIELPLSELKKHNWPLEVPLMPTYTLENMVMSVNRFAHATAISVIETPGKLYNPLVLHGATGTGKTHFLNAMAYAFSKKFGQENIFMTNGVRLSRGIQRYVMEGNIEKFEKFMSTVKVLLIDDIHLLAINEQNRTHISALLNKFLREQKQIVITSKYPPESLEKLEELIRFRLDSGWISELKPANGSNHFRIVKKMLLSNGIDLNDTQIATFFGGPHMTLSTIMRSIHRLKVLENLIFPNMPEEQRSQANIFEKLLATTGEDATSELVHMSPEDVTSISTLGNGEWGRIGFFYPQHSAHMMNWMVYALQQRAKELGIPGGFEIAVRSSYATENIISSAFKIANLCDNKKLKGAVILGPALNVCEPSVRENFYDILTHMLEIMLIRCGIINAEAAQAPSMYVKVLAELLR